MKRLLFLVFLGVLGAAAFRTFLFEGIYLKTDSMSPTLPQGRHVFVSKLSYLFSSPKRNDIIMFTTPQAPGKGYVKRIIAIPGDTIAIKNKAVYLNDKLLEESFTQYLRPDDILVGDNIPPIEIPEGHVFVMGDNRDHSGDSRIWKTPDGEWSPFVPISQIKGAVIEP